MPVRGKGKHMVRDLAVSIDIGRRIKLRREDLKMTQAELGRLLDVSEMQVLKYEAGRTRVSAPALLHIANALHTEVAYFFDPSPMQTDVFNRLASDMAEVNASLAEVTALLRRLLSNVKESAADDADDGR